MASGRKGVVLDVLVIGAGVSGIGAAIRLKAAGITAFRILEKAASPGGTWRDNTYPGCACDVPSALYSYSFAQTSRWTRLFAAQPEILAYVQETAQRHALDAYIEYNAPAEQATWHERDQCWSVRTPDRVWRARTLIVCTGYLHEPVWPDLPGLDAFQGRVFHSSRWDHRCHLRGQRVAVIGTGASAIQFIPEIAPQVATLNVYQRTPPWILPKLDLPMPSVVRDLLRLPGAKALLRGLLYGGFESFGIGFRHPRVLRQLEYLARAHLRVTVRDPQLRARLTPDYTLGCKRILLSNNYYPALTRANVDVLATGVVAIEGNTVVGADGSRREADVIILGTGFHVSEQPIAACIHGEDGRTLAQVWAGSPQAYKGSVVAGFPNLFLMLGPNLAIGHNSAFIVIEAQLEYALAAIKTQHLNGIGRLAVRPEAQHDYNERVQVALQRTVWNTGGCSSYYLDANGRNSIGFPWSTLTMRRLLAEFDLANFDVQPLRRGVAPSAS